MMRKSLFSRSHLSRFGANATDGHKNDHKIASAMGKSITPSMTEVEGKRKKIVVKKLPEGQSWWQRERP
ncbi:hypothetical protein V6Z11_A13G236700 [Gossypium hirsutum]